MGRREWYKWRVDGKLDWEEYQEAEEEVFIEWEIKVRELEQELGGGVEEVWSRWKEKVIAVVDNYYFCLKPYWTKLEILALLHCIALFIVPALA